MSNHQSSTVYAVTYDSDDLFVNCIRIGKKILSYFCSEKALPSLDIKQNV